MGQTHGLARKLDVRLVEWVKSQPVGEKERVRALTDPAYARKRMEQEVLRKDGLK